ncbi:MAG: 4-hydroxythreonine-4-phosphate dehydrogenase PdxA [Leptospiraceae bacterium]|nr:4-hydroxythreonine-4-phosphate dehydrogenase PdxA [Leptospiraceae bacterium]
MKDLTPIVVSQGDVAGVGWELLLSLLQKKKIPPEICNRLIVVGDSFTRDKNLSKLFSVEEYSEQFVPNIQKSKKPKFLYLNTNSAYEPGKPSAALALRSYAAFQKSIKLWQNLDDAALVTLPVSKEYIRKAGVQFAGHTEVLQAAYNTTTHMCMYHKTLSVMLLTNHVPLAKVTRVLPSVNADALASSISFFRALFAPQRPFVMAGVNPHAGENGTLGTEESILREIIATMETKGVNVSGPLPADGIFTKLSRKNYSLVLAVYHDQGLIPFKALYGYKGLNITLGLPKLRVSPDHGTGYGIAGKAEADDTGILESILFAAKWSKKWTSVYSSL